MDDSAPAARSSIVATARSSTSTGWGDPSPFMGMSSIKGTRPTIPVLYRRRRDPTASIAEAVEDLVEPNLAEVVGGHGPRVPGRSLLRAGRNHVQIAARLRRDAGGTCGCETGGSWSDGPGGDAGRGCMCERQ